MSDITLGNIRHLTDELDNAKEDSESLHHIGKELIWILTYIFLKYKSIPANYHNEILYNLTNGSFDDYEDMTTKLHGDGVDIYGRV